MKTIKLLFGGLIFILFFFTTCGWAQEGHYYEITTWKLQVTQDGPRDELNSLMKQFSENVVFKNDKVISQKIMHHVSGADVRDVVIISEYANWNDIDAANKLQNKLIDEAWPTDDERGKFFKSWGKYVVTHADEIYQEIPELSKK